MTYTYFQLNPEDNLAWQKIISLGSDNADRVEFNVLYSNPGTELKQLLNQFEGSRCTLSKSESSQRFYPSTNRIWFPATKKLKEWMENITFVAFAGYVIEDPSFVKDGIEFIGTITHENMCRIQDDFTDAFKS